MKKIFPLALLEITIQLVLTPPSFATEIFDAVILGHQHRLAAILARDPESVHAFHSASGLMPLHFASSFGEANICRLLIDNGAHIEAITPDGHTPLHIAARNGHIDAVKRLLEAQANVEAMDRNDLRPLHWAAINGRDRIVQLLIIAGADIHARIRGKTPLLLAQERGHERIVDILKPDAVVKVHLDIALARASHRDLNRAALSLRRAANALTGMEKSEIAHLFNELAGTIGKGLSAERDFFRFIHTTTEEAKIDEANRVRMNAWKNASITADNTLKSILSSHDGIGSEVIIELLSAIDDMNTTS